MTNPHPPLDPTNCIDAAALYLAREPDAVDRALRTHLPGKHGRCITCGPSYTWPCAVAASARRAQQFVDQRLCRRSRRELPTRP